MDLTLMTKQAAELRAKHSDCLVLMATDNHYYSFGCDTAVIKDIIKSVAPKTEDSYIAGKGYQAFKRCELDWILPKIIRQGFRVAICETMEEPRREFKRSY